MAKFLVLLVCCLVLTCLIAYSNSTAQTATDFVEVFDVDVGAAAIMADYEHSPPDITVAESHGSQLLVTYADLSMNTSPAEADVSGQIANCAVFYAAATDASCHFTISSLNYYLSDDLNAADSRNDCLAILYFSRKYDDPSQDSAALSGNVQDNNRYVVINPRRHQTSMSMTNKFV